MSRVLLIRHAETAHNSEGRLSTAAPGGPLSERGVEQAERLAEDLAGTSLEALYTSPLTRARQTAEVIARRQGLKVAVNSDLAEFSTGELDGRTDKEAFEVLNAALDAWCRFEHEVRLGRDGDTGTAVCKRLDRFVRKVASKHPSGTVAVISHGGLLQVGIPWISRNLGPGFALQRFIRNTGIIELEVEDGGAYCVSWEEVDPAELSEKEEGICRD